MALCPLVLLYGEDVQLMEYIRIMIWGVNMATQNRVRTQKCMLGALVMHSGGPSSSLGRLNYISGSSVW
jgi:hypothetical protein